MLTAVIIVFVTAMLIHSGTHALMGPRANGLPGGAIGMAVVTSLRLESQPDAPMFWAMLVVLLNCAVLGHACSVALWSIVQARVFRAK